MSQPNFFIKLSNPVIILLLRSPLHGILSRSTMLITVKGKKSGKAYTTPVNYLRQGDVLYTLSSRDRSWWRNLRGGAAVTLFLQGKEVTGKGTVIEDDRGVAEALTTYLQLAPQYARYLGIRMDEQGNPLDQDLIEKARSRVMVRIDLGC
jgi:deazaflavin-dependent oxidoreductase (nitroreductase family)